MFAFKIFIYFGLITISFRALDFMFQSLDWSLEYCIDMILMKYFSWEFEKSKLPFIDFYTYNLPVTIYLNWFWAKIIGATDFSFRILDNIWYILLSISSFFYFKRYSIFASISAFVFCLTLPMNATNFGAFQRETMFLVFWVLGIYSFEKILNENHLKLHFILLGIYFSLSFFIKPTSIFLFGFIFLYLIYLETAKKKFFEFKKNLILSVLSFLIISIFIFLPFILKKQFNLAVSNWYLYFLDLNSSLEIKSFNELTKGIINFRFKDWSRPLNGFSSEQEYQINPGRFGLLSVFSFLISVILYFRKKVNITVFILFFSSLANYYTQMKGFTYHLFPLWLSFIYFQLLCLNYFYNQLKEANLIKKSISVFFILFFLISILIQEDRSLKRYLGTGLYSKKTFENRILPSSYTNKYLNELNQKLNKKVKFQNFETYHSISLYSSMKFDFELVSKFPEGYIFYGIDSRYDKYKKEMINSLTKNPPDIVLLSREGAFQEKKDLFKTFPELKKFLKNYQIYKTYHELNLVNYSIYVKY